MMTEVVPKRLSILIGTRNRRSLLEEALASLAACRIPTGWTIELVVVDNGSSDGTAEAVTAASARLPFSVRCVREPQPGLGRAHAAGLQACHGELIACTDDDCRVTPEWCEAIVDAFTVQPELGGLFGRVLPLDPQEASAYRVAVKTSETPATYRFPCWPVIGFGNNMTFRRAALESVGGFSALFGPGGVLWSGEELELSYRLLRRGWCLAYVPSVTLWHHARSTHEAWAGTHRRDALGFGAFAGLHAVRGDGYALKLAVWEWTGMWRAWWRGSREGDARRREVGGAYTRWLPVGFLAGAWRGVWCSPYPARRTAIEARIPGVAPQISVIVCTRNRATMLRHTLESLLESSAAPGFPFEVVVVDNDSRDETQVVIGAAQQRYGSRVVAVYESRPGLSRARNAGLRVARGALAAFTDDDCLVSPDWVQRIGEAFRADGGLGGIFGRVLPLEAEAGAAVVSVKIADSPQRYHFPCSPFIGHGNNMVFRRAALQVIGGFDVALGAGGPLRSAEDLDAAYRLLRRGETLAYDPRCVVYHRPRGTAKEASATEWRNAVGLGACFGKYILHGDFYALKCVYWLLRNLPGASLRDWRLGHRYDAKTRWLFVAGVPYGILIRWIHMLCSLVSREPGRREPLRLSEGKETVAEARQSAVGPLTGTLPRHESL